MDINQYMINNALSGVFFDIGANVGQYTVSMSKKATTVYAFEPASVNFELLINNTKDCHNVVLEKKAISNITGLTKLYSMSNPPPGCELLTISSELSIHEGWGLESFEEVAMITLDEYCTTHNITNITGMKIDVETAEQYVLEGASETLKNNNILICLETHFPTDLTAIYNLIKQNGYTPYINGDTEVNELQFWNRYICRK